MSSAPANTFKFNAGLHSILREESQVLNSQSAELRAKASEALMTCRTLRARCRYLGGRITHRLRRVPNRLPDSFANGEGSQRCRTIGASSIEQQMDARSSQTLRQCDAIRCRLQQTWHAIEKSRASMSTTRTHLDQTVDRLFTCRQTRGTQFAGPLYESLIARETAALRW